MQTNRIITEKTFEAWEKDELQEYYQYVLSQPNNLTNDHILSVVKNILDNYGI